MIAGLLLAAGGARRFGTQKLVATLDGAPLVRHAASHLANDVDALVIVVGASSDALRAALVGIPAVLVDNQDWQQGLATSIRLGISALPPDADCVVIALGDEPRVERDVIRRVVAVWRSTGAPIVAPRYQGRRGHPVLFSRLMFGDLSALHGDTGARTIIGAHASDVAYVDMDAMGPSDIDTPADLERLRQ